MTTLELPRIYSGAKDACHSPGFTIVHACKTCHKGICGQPTPDHPEYLSAERNSSLYLNMIDPALPLFRVEMFHQFLDWVLPRYHAGQQILIHCDRGESRSRSLVLLLGAALHLLPRESYFAACEAFESPTAAGRPYTPSQGIMLFLADNWSDILASHG